MELGVIMLSEVFQTHKDISTCQIFIFMCVSFVGGVQIVKLKATIKGKISSKVVIEGGKQKTFNIKRDYWGGRNKDGE